MFRNIGKQIKGIALFLCTIEILAALGIAAFTGYRFWQANAEPLYAIGLPVAIIVGGLLFAWLSNLVMYSYGQLVDNTDRIARNTDILVKRSKGNY